jgi:hypothetical protein
LSVIDILHRMLMGLGRVASDLRRQWHSQPLSRLLLHDPILPQRKMRRWCLQCASRKFENVGGKHHCKMSLPVARHGCLQLGSSKRKPVNPASQEPLSIASSLARVCDQRVHELSSCFLNQKHNNVERDCGPFMSKFMMQIER